MGHINLITGMKILRKTLNYNYKNRRIKIDKIINSMKFFFVLMYHYIISCSNCKPYLTSSLSVSSPLVQMTDSFRDSITSLASHLSFSALPAFRCLSFDTARPESSVIVNSGAAIENTLPLQHYSSSTSFHL